MAQQAPQLFRGRMYKRDNAELKEHRVLVLKTGIAGLNFNIESKEEEGDLKKIRPGVELELFREPNNKYDEWAIAVYLNKTDKLGYVTRFKNETIARLMDAGKKFIAVVDEIEDNQRKAEEERAPTENMKLPFSIYLIEEN